MVSMDDERINRWKCQFCGSRQKKRIDIIGQNNRKIGFALHCCNCGHIDNFGMTSAALNLMVGSDSSKAKSLDTKCGVFLKDITCCPAMKCPYRPVDPDAVPPTPTLKNEETNEGASKEMQPEAQSLKLDPKYL